MKNLIIRTISGIVFVAVVVGCILWGPLSYAILFAAISGLTTWEFCTIINQHLDCQINRIITTTASVYFFAALMAFNMNMTGSEVFIPYLITIVYLLVSEIYFKNNNSLLNWSFALMSQIYIALPLALLNTLSFFGVSMGIGSHDIFYNPIFTLSVFIFIWVGDSAAYGFGTWLGRNKLFPRISPKKSWEGTISAFIISVIISQIIATYFTYFSTDNDLYNRLAWAGLSIVVVGFGTWGDLVESLIKRRLGIKDSGSFLPGHGGLLDRFDSSLIAIPMAAIYIYTLNQFML